MVKNQIDDQKCRQESCNANWFVRIREFALQILQINRMLCGGAMIYCIKRKGGRLFSGNLLIKCPDLAYFNKLIVLRKSEETAKIQLKKVRIWATWVGQSST